MARLNETLALLAALLAQPEKGDSAAPTTPSTLALGGRLIAAIDALTEVRSTRANHIQDARVPCFNLDCFILHLCILQFLDKAPFTFRRSSLIVVKR